MQFCACIILYATDACDLMVLMLTDLLPSIGFEEAKLQIAFIVRFLITVLVGVFNFLSTVLAQDHFYSDFLSLHVTI